MNLYGFSDSLADVGKNAGACQRCGAMARIANGLCLGCLLQPALSGEGSNGESFAAVLGEIDLHDTEWRLGNYQVLDEIGRGGMGVIYRARQRHSRRIVALKRILGHHADSRETLARFRREAEAAASLDHPNILPIYEVGEGEDGLPFFSMKYAAGGSLLEAAPALRREPRRCVALMAKVAHAVHFAHSHGILHRDLKPGNVLLDVCGEPLVSDFGLAKWLDTSTDLTRTLTIFGTPGYIAPEQARSTRAQLTPAADIYSLGAILFDLFTGQPPFLGEHALAVIQQASEKEAPKLRSLASALDRDLETICAKCLEREPQARYQSADALAGDLERWLDGWPITARRVQPPVRIWRWSKRNPIVATATASAVIFAFTAGFLFFSRYSALPVTQFDKSIAVLPFENLNQEKTNTYIAEGIQGEILTKLAAMRDLKVISRSSSAKYQSRPDNLKGVAHELGVATILEGAVQRAGNKVHANVQLIDARTDTQLWANSYERELKDLFTVESDIAEEIAEALKANLSPRELHALAAAPTRNTEAYDLFLRAEYEFHQAESSLAAADYDRAETFYRQALAQDPNFVGAAAGLVYSQLYRHWFVSHLAPRQLEEARSLCDRALALSPDSPEAHFALGIFFYWGQRRYDEALREFKRALQLQPNNALGRQYCAWVSRRRGDWERSIADAQRAEDLDPRDSSIPMNLGITYALLRQWKNAKQVQVRALAIDPHNVIAAMILAMTHLNSTGNIGSARRAFEGISPGLRTSSPSVHGDVANTIGVRVYLDVIERRFPEAFQTLENEAPNGERTQLLAAHAALGVLAGENEAARSAAEQVLPQLEVRLKEIPDDTVAMTELAWVYLALGRNNDALRVARQPADLISVQRDTVSGPLFQTGLAQIQARAGAPDEAVNSLRRLMSIPAGQWISLARLKIDPVWDLLRNRPDFQQLLSGKELIGPRSRLRPSAIPSSLTDSKAQVADGQD
jgi:serine/threonine protein kinase/Tfp pilus assembly protein PilF